MKRGERWVGLAQPFEVKPVLLRFAQQDSAGQHIAAFLPRLLRFALKERGQRQIAEQGHLPSFVSGFVPQIM